MNVLKWIALVISLGLDSLAMATGLGLSGIKHRVRIALVFALAEALMPALGFLLGQSIGGWLGTYGPWVGAIAVLSVGVFLLFEEDEEAEEIKKKGDLTGLALFVAALTISLDELAVGFSIGMLGLPIVWTLVVLAMQAFVFTWIGLTFGSYLRPLLGEAAEKVAGIVLVLLGGYWLVELIF